MPDYTPLALKYRPRKLADLVGQDVLVRTLANAIKMDRVHQAYLFVGSHGCGKTTAARVLAACLNNPGGETVSPDATPETDAIFKGNAIDVIEIDAASNGKVENIRDIKDESRWSPTTSKYKVYIIDEAHAMSRDAVQAMLKILEEPPAYVKFILCTTEQNKITPTIHSRCQVFRFRQMPWNLIAAHIKVVAKSEGVTIDDDGAKAIAKKADGHMRDALQHLDTSIVYAGEGVELTGELVRQAIGSVDESLYFEFVSAVLNVKFADGVRACQKMLLSGHNAGAVANGLLDHLRTLMVIAVGENTSGIISLSDEEKKSYVAQRQLMKADLIDDMITNLVQIHRGLFYSTSPQVLFEQFLLRSIKTHHRLRSAA